MTLKKIFTLAISLLLIFALSACTSNEKSEETSTIDKQQEQSDSNQEQARTVEHAMGVTEIKGEPKEIVILTNEGTEALLTLGVKPVGAVKSWTGDPWYDHITGEMEGVANVGTESQVNLEEIAALEPDLIIGNKMRQEKIYDQLSLIAPTVFAETLRGDWRENFEFYSKALNKEKEGQEILNDFDNRIQSIAEKAGDKLNTEISVLRFLPGQTRIYLKDSFAGVIFNQIGFKRPESQDINDFAIKIGKERLQEADGDVIFYFTYETGDGEGVARKEEWLNDPLFKNLGAAKNKKVFEVDDAIWNTAGGIMAANLMLDDINKFLDNNDL